MTCCQLADDEVVEQEAEQFDCAACPVRERMTGLDAENREAWSAYQTCANRFVVDYQAGPVLLDRLTRDWDADDFVALMERLRIIYDTLQPPKER